MCLWAGARREAGGTGVGGGWGGKSKKHFNPELNINNDAKKNPLVAH